MEIFHAQVFLHMHFLVVFFYNERLCYVWKFKMMKKMWNKKTDIRCNKWWKIYSRHLIFHPIFCFQFQCRWSCALHLWFKKFYNALENLKVNAVIFRNTKIITNDIWFFSPLNFHQYLFCCPLIFLNVLNLKFYFIYSCAIHMRTFLAIKIYIFWN